MAQRIVRTAGAKGRAWSARPTRARAYCWRAAAAGLVALLAWAWWPSGQYQPVRASDNGTLSGAVHLVSSPASAARPAVAGPAGQPRAGQAPCRRDDPGRGRDQGAPGVLRHQGREGPAVGGDRERQRTRDGPDARRWPDARRYVVARGRRVHGLDRGGQPGPGRSFVGQDCVAVRADPPQARRARPPARRSRRRRSRSSCRASPGRTTPRRWPPTTPTAASSTTSSTRW